MHIFGAAGGAAISLGHSDYAAYDNYSDYSDNHSGGNNNNRVIDDIFEHVRSWFEILNPTQQDDPEVKRRKLAALRSDTESAARELSNYKRYTVNDQLSTQALKQQTAMRVNEASMNDDVHNRIRRQIASDEASETSQLTRELAAIDELITKISTIERAV